MFQTTRNVSIVFSLYDKTFTLYSILSIVNICKLFKTLVIIYLSPSILSVATCITKLLLH